MQKIIDAHCHIYPEKIAARAIEGINSFYGLNVKSKGTVNDLIERESKYGVVHYLCHSVATDPRQVHAINTFISDEMHKQPELITGFGSLHPASETLEDDLAELVSLGLKGVKLHPDFQSFDFDGERSIEMCSMIRDANLPILVHAGDKRFDYSSPYRIKNLFEAVPGLRLIVAHLGGWSKWDEAIENLEHLGEGFFVDSSSCIDFTGPEKVTELIHRYGSERVFFGTDFPMWEIDAELERFNKLGLTEEERERILWKNIAEFLDIEDIVGC